MLMLCSNIFCILNCTNFVWKHNNSSLFFMQNELKLFQFLKVYGKTKLM